MTEADFLTLLRTLPLHPGALGLANDAARLAGEFVVTTDTLVEGVHFLPADPPDDVAWKLVAVNLSDLAGKGAAPVAVLLNYPLSEDGWDRAFVAGLAAALREFDCALLGGDTVSLPPGAPRVLTLTAFGAGVGSARSGAQPGDALWVCGTIGDAGAGLRIARGASGPPALLAAYRRPRPLLADGQALAPHVGAMMDVSDGLLLDASRMAAASDLAVTIELRSVPLSPALRGFDPDPLIAATAGDDYALLFALPPGVVPTVPAARIGRFAPGSGLTLTDRGAPVALPANLGWLHAAPLA
ncbi:MAG: thiamine-phosphate kinase [Pseudomonadota bacterium]